MPPGIATHHDEALSHVGTLPAAGGGPGREPGRRQWPGVRSPRLPSLLQQVHADAATSSIAAGSGVNEDMPFACPEDCLFFEPRHVTDTGWTMEGGTPPP